MRNPEEVFAELRRRDVERMQRLADSEWDEEDSPPLPPLSLAQLRTLVPDLARETSIVLLKPENAPISRKEYHGIHPRTIIQGGAEVPVWLLVSNVTNGVAPHVYLHPSGILYHSKVYRDSRKWVLGKFWRHEDSITFDEYLSPLHADDVLNELREAYAQLEKIIPSVGHYHKFVQDKAVVEREEQRRKNAAAAAMVGVEEKRRARRAAFLASGGHGGSSSAP